jgi:hypothetical protein
MTHRCQSLNSGRTLIVKNREHIKLKQAALVSSGEIELSVDRRLDHPSSTASYAVRQENENVSFLGQYRHKDCSPTKTKSVILSVAGIPCVDHSL